MSLETKLYILDLGWEKLDKNFLLSNSNVALVHDENPDFEWARIPIQAYLIQDGDKTILFDTGCDPEYKVSWPPFIEEQSPYFVDDDQQLIPSLKELGIAPHDVDYVVMSHLHVDHAGNLFEFTESTVFVNEIELLYTLRGYATGRDMDVHVPSDVNNFLNANLNWKLITNDIWEYSLTPNVTILNLGSGHSFGMLALCVKLADFGSVLLVADAIYLEENIKPEIRTPGILYDSLGYRRSIDRLLSYQSQHNCTIFYGHDIEQFNGLKKSPDFYS